MVKGGFQYIDMKNAALENSTGTIIAGIYDAIEGALKPIVLENVAVGETELGSVPVKFTVSGSDFVGFILTGIDASTGVTGYKITVDDDDKVKAVAVTYKAAEAE